MPADRGAGRAAQPLRACRRGRGRRSTTGGLAARPRCGAAHRRPRPDEPRRARRGARRDRKPGGEFQRRRRRAGVLVPAARAARAFRLQDGEYARQHDRPSNAALPRLWLGGGAARRCSQHSCRRRSAGCFSQRRRCSPRDAGRVARWRSCCATAASTTRPMRVGRRARWRGRSVWHWPDRAATPRASSPIRGSATARARAATSDIVRALQLYRLACLIEGGLLLGAWLAVHAHAALLRRGGRAAASSAERSRLLLEVIGERVEGRLDLVLVGDVAAVRRRARHKGAAEGVARKQPVQIAAGDPPIGADAAVRAAARRSIGRSRPGPASLRDAFRSRATGIPVASSTPEASPSRLSPVENGVDVEEAESRHRLLSALPCRADRQCCRPSI